MRQVLRSGGGLLLLVAIMLPRLAPAICHWTDRPCAPEHMMQTDTGWSNPADMSHDCPSSDCSLVQVAPVLALDRPVAQTPTNTLTLANPNNPSLPVLSLLTPPPRT